MSCCFRHAMASLVLSSCYSEWFYPQFYLFPQHTVNCHSWRGRVGMAEAGSSPGPQVVFSPTAGLPWSWSVGAGQGSHHGERALVDLPPWELWPQTETGNWTFCTTMFKLKWWFSNIWLLPKITRRWILMVWISLNHFFNFTIKYYPPSHAWGSVFLTCSSEGSCSVSSMST